MRENRGFYTSYVSAIPDNVKFFGKRNYEMSVIVCRAPVTFTLPRKGKLFNMLLHNTVLEWLREKNVSFVEKESICLSLRLIENFKGLFK